MPHQSLVLLHTRLDMFQTITHDTLLFGPSVDDHKVVWMRGQVQRRLLSDAVCRTGYKDCPFETGHYLEDIFTSSWEEETYDLSRKHMSGGRRCRVSKG